MPKPSDVTPAERPTPSKVGQVSLIKVVEAKSRHRRRDASMPQMRCDVLVLCMCSRMRIKRRARQPSKGAGAETD